MSRFDSWPTILVSTCASLAGAAWLGLASVSAQEPPSAIFGERVDVRVVDLEVVITDRSGQRVTGLGPQDLRVEVDGRQVTLDHFVEVRGGRASWPSPSHTGTEPTPLAAPGAVRQGEPVATNVLVFIDDYFTRIPRDRDRVLAGVEEQLGRLRPEDRVAVVAFDGRRPRLLADWTSSHREIERALRVARGERPKGQAIAASVAAQDAFGAASQQLEEDVATDATELGDSDSPQPDVQAWNPSVCHSLQTMERRIERLALGLAGVLRSLPQPTGRKVALVLSGGAPWSAASFYLGDNPAGRGRCGAKGSALWKPVYETANLLGYTLYPVDVPLAKGTRASAGDRTFSDPSMQDLIRVDAVHSTLFRLAEETGGRAFVDNAQLSALAGVTEDTDSYYWLGFTPDWRGDDRYHRIEVKAVLPGLKVRHRAGFQDLSPGARVDLVTESAVLFGTLPGAQPLGIELGPLPGGRGKMEVPLKLAIPMDWVTMLPQRKGFRADLELRVAVVDDEGNRNEIAAQPVVLEGDGPPPPGSHSVYETTLRLRRQPYDLVVTLYQPLSDTLFGASGRIDP